MDAILGLAVGTGLLVGGTVSTYFGKKMICEGAEGLKNKNNGDDKNSIIEENTNIEQDE